MLRSRSATPPASPMFTLATPTLSSAGARLSSSPRPAPAAPLVPPPRAGGVERVGADLLEPEPLGELERLAAEHDRLFVLVCKHTEARAVAEDQRLRFRIARTRQAAGGARGC